MKGCIEWTFLDDGGWFLEGRRIGFGDGLKSVEEIGRMRK